MRVRALTLRICRQFIRDKRTLALLFVAPLFILTLVYFIFGGSGSPPKIGAVGLPNAIVSGLEASADVVDYGSWDEALEDLRGQDLDAVLALRSGKPALLLEGSDPSRSRAVLLAVSALQRQSASQALQPEISYLHGKAGMSSFDSFGPVMIGFFSFFFVFLLAGVAFLRERTTGTMERLLATPIRRQEVVLGYLCGFGVFALAQAALIACFAVYVLGMYMTGSIWLILLVNLLLTLTALTLGTLLSAFAGSEFQIIQFVPIVIVPQAFFSGLFPLDGMSPWLHKLTYLMPLYYGGDALRGIMIRGEGFGGIAADIAVLVVFSLSFAALNVVALRKQRAI
ncbi:ABC transporter permease [Cohnella sp. JJ-181]|uniref:ABC transporter permease n=1 Tax=Cohnella rhizoplanae TaxID=2974897 RepID=UPI0022FF5F7A|nr:ABC transporter permease [Cohnella sp. JJ-181]CAI6030873.1 putative multidrug ABC transporter permease YbhS [Cohnella sp. JJ-181]